MAAALAPHKQAPHHMVAHGTHAGTLPTLVTEPTLAIKRALAGAAVEVKAGGRLVEDVHSLTRTQSDHLCGYRPQLKAVQ